MEDWGGVIDGLLGEVRKVVKEHNKGLTGFTDSVQAFVHAVDWKEPWIIGLFASHICMLVFILLTRKLSDIHTFLFIILLVMVYMAETVNQVLGDNWELFSNQNYFDKNGFFISVVYSSPLVILLMIVLVNQIIQMAKLMVKVKSAQLKVESRKATQQIKEQKKNK
mmetsp:Transcript_5770/g.10974  ORF Transcript_5770/g.10974 Transcript_5770/m.10974 type:complete len:166 (-) Transcript_5770:242-739(-)